MEYIRKEICPLIGKECIRDGYEYHKSNCEVFRPCMYWEEYSPSDVEPCKMKRAINRILGEPDFPDTGDKPVDIPF